MESSAMASGEKIGIKKAAEILKVEPYQIWYQIRSGRFAPKHSLGENAYGIDVDEELPVLQKLLEESAGRARRRPGSRLKYLPKQDRGPKQSR